MNVHLAALSLLQRADAAGAPSPWLCGKGNEISNLGNVVPNYSKENMCHCFLGKNSSSTGAHSICEVFPNGGH